MDADKGDAVILRRIRQYVKQRRIRVQDFFVDFDRRHEGACSPTRFARALDRMGLSQRLDVFGSVLEFAERYYLIPGQPQLMSMNYRAFIKDMEFEDDPVALSSTAQSFAPDGRVGRILEQLLKLERTRGVDFQTCYAHFRSSKVSVQQFIRHFPCKDLKDPFTQADIECLAEAFADEEGLIDCQAIWDALARTEEPISGAATARSDFFAKTDPMERSPRRIGALALARLAEGFQDCDVLRTGSCTVGQARVLLGEAVGRQEIGRILDTYTLDDGRFAHARFCADMEKENRDVTTSPGTTWSNSTLSVMDKVRAKVVEKRTRLTELFRDSDMLRKGVCNAGYVKTVFSISDIAKHLSDQDVQEILALYSRDNTMFDYLKFCADAERDFTNPGLVRDPMLTVSMPDASTTSPGRRNRMVISSPEVATSIEQLLDQILNSNRMRPVNLLSEFQDMDRRNRGYVSRTQFFRVIGRLKINMSEKNMHLLTVKFGDKGTPNELNYLDIVQRVDPTSEEVLQGSKARFSPRPPETPPKYFDGRGMVRPFARATLVM